MNMTFQKILIFSFSLFFMNMTMAQKMKKKFQTVKVELRIDAPAEKVWEAMVLDYGAISNFSPYIYASNYEAGSLKGEVGAERKCSFNAKGSQWVHEKIKSIDHDKRVMVNVPIDGAKLPLDYENTQPFYTVRKNPDGSSTAGYEMQFRTRPAFMGMLAKGGFKKQLGGTLVGLKHFVETGEKVNLANDKYEEIKGKYPRATVLD